MYLAFIDESGSIQENDPQNNYYILTSAVMQEKGMKYLYKNTQDLKKDIWNMVQGPNCQMPIEFELHMHEIKMSKGYFKPLKGLKDKAEIIIRKVYSFIQNLYIKIISIIIIKDKFFEQYEPESILTWALHPLIERINQYVMGKSKDIEEYALLIMDECFALDKKRREIISKMMEVVNYKIYGVKNILDTPLFLNSKFHNGIQIVDSIAFLVNNYTKKKLENNRLSLFDTLSDDFMYDLTWKFYGGIPSYSNQSGLKIFPSNFTPPIGFWEVFQEP